MITLGLDLGTSGVQACCWTAPAHGFGADHQKKRAQYDFPDLPFYAVPDPATRIASCHSATLCAAARASGEALLSST